MPHTSRPKRKAGNKKSTEDGSSRTLEDLLEQLLSILRPRMPARVPVRKPAYPRRIR
jgi:hypothetical protein